MSLWRSRDVATISQYEIRDKRVHVRKWKMEVELKVVQRLWTMRQLSSGTTNYI